MLKRLAFLSLGLSLNLLQILQKSKISAKRVYLCRKSTPSAISAEIAEGVGLAKFLLAF
jgi:hypothetical protein